MTILAIWQKQLQNITKKEARALLLLSYKRLVRVLGRYAYFLIPVIIGVFCLSFFTQGCFWYLFSFFTVFLSQVVALLLRPSRYKKDLNYLIRMLKQQYGTLVIIPLVSLLFPKVFLLLFLIFAVFLQLILADLHIRKIGFLNKLRAAILLIWYNLPVLFVAISSMYILVWLLSELQMSSLIGCVVSTVLYLSVLFFTALFVLLYIVTVYEHEEIIK